MELEVTIKGGMVVSGIQGVFQLINKEKFNVNPLCWICLFIWGLTSLSTLYRSYHDG